MRRLVRIKPEFPVILLLTMLASCREGVHQPSARRHPAELPKPEAVKVPDGLSEDKQRLLADFNRALEASSKDWELERADRAQLVAGAEPGYVAQVSGASITLRLSAVESFVRAKRPLRYRLEILNIGTEPVRLVDVPWSFLKRGDVIGWESFFRILVWNPDGKQTTAGRPLPRPIGHQRDNSEFGVSLRLLPGESLSARGWDGEGPSSNFERDLVSDIDFSAPGTYRIQVSVDAAIIGQIGRVESNRVEIEVAR